MEKILHTSPSCTITSREVVCGEVYNGYTVTLSAGGVVVTRKGPTLVGALRALAKVKGLGAQVVFEAQTVYAQAVLVDAWVDSL